MSEMSQVIAVDAPAGETSAPTSDGPTAHGDVAAPARYRRALRGIAQRLAGMVFVLWGVATLTWITSKAAPGDEALAMLGGGAANPPPELLAAVRKQYGLDRPLTAQYLDYFRHLLAGDLGYSTAQQRPVSTAIADNLMPTVQLAAAGILLAWVMVTAWTLLTVKRHRPVSTIGLGLEVLAVSVPAYWLGMLLLDVFSFRLGWIPTIGATGFRALVLPAVTMALPLAGLIGQVTRQGFETILEQPFITSARARGMSDWAVRFRHALRHGILPGLSVLGLALGSAFSGAVVVESLFARPGIGLLLLSAVLTHDTKLTIGITLLVAATYVLANLLVDVLYRFADPRLKGTR